MRIIKIDAASWRNVTDFYDALLPRLGAPEGHGKNLNALVESMVWGRINSLKPPYAVQIFNTKNVPPAVLLELKGAEEDVPEARLEFQARKGFDVEVSFEIVS